MSVNNATNQTANRKIRSPHSPRHPLTAHKKGGCHCQTYEAMSEPPSGPINARVSGPVLVIVLSATLSLAAVVGAILMRTHMRRKQADLETQGRELRAQQSFPVGLSILSHANDLQRHDERRTGRGDERETTEGPGAVVGQAEGGDLELPSYQAAVKDVIVPPSEVLVRTGEPAAVAEVFGPPHYDTSSYAR